MAEQGQPRPQRIGDAERDHAAELLREHLVAGRLTPEEFDGRVDAALRATVAGDLDPLFDDLPGPRPGADVVATQPGQAPSATVPAPVAPTQVAPDPVPPRRTAPAVLSAALWPATILLISALGWDSFWWLVFVPVILSSVLGKQQHDRHEDRRRQLARDQERLDRRRRALDD